MNRESYTTPQHVQSILDQWLGESGWRKHHLHVECNIRLIEAYVPLMDDETRARALRTIKALRAGGAW